MQEVEGKNGRYQNDKGVFACLEALLRRTDRRRRSRTQGLQRSRGILIKADEGETNK
jgi:hypothetical protein